MARIRSVKPEFHSHEELSSLPAETHLFAQALMIYADDEGYFNANPVLVKAGTNPLRNDATPTEEKLAQLEKIGYVVIRREGARCIGRIVTFLDHQKVTHPAPSKLKSKYEGLTRNSGEVHEVLTPELNRTELNRTEAVAVVEQAIEPTMVVSGVLSELCISGRELRVVLDEVVKAESLKPGYSPEATRDALVAAWREYDGARARLSYPVGAQRFFGEGIWRNKAAWTWKDGARPDEVKPTTAAEKLRRAS